MTYSYPQDMSSQGAPEVQQEPADRCPRCDSPATNLHPAVQQEPVQDWYFTFAANHLHPFTCESLGRSYVVINGTERDAIRVVRDVFGDQWAHYYVSPRQAGVEEYDLQHLPLPVQSFDEQVDGHLRRLEDDRYAARPALSTPAEERGEEQLGGAAALRTDELMTDVRLAVATLRTFIVDAQPRGVVLAQLTRIEQLVRGEQQ